MSTDVLGKKLLRVDETAELFRVTPRTVYNWIDSGVLDSRKVGRVVRITVTSVRVILDGNGGD